MSTSNERRGKQYEIKDRPKNVPPIITEHYHVTYDSIPDFKKIYTRPRAAYWEVKLMGEMSEPDTEWYEDGRVLIHARLPERTGLHKIILEVTACTMRACRQRIERSTDEELLLEGYSVVGRTNPQITY